MLKPIGRLKYFLGVLGIWVVFGIMFFLILVVKSAATGIDAVDLGTTPVFAFRATMAVSIVMMFWEYKRLRDIVGEHESSAAPVIVVIIAFVLKAISLVWQGWPLLFLIALASVGYRIVLLFKAGAYD